MYFFVASRNRMIGPKKAERQKEHVSKTAQTALFSGFLLSTADQLSGEIL